MKRVISSCRLARPRPSLRQSSRQARRTATTLAAQNAETARDEQQKDYKPANPLNMHSMSPAHPYSGISSNSLRDSGVAEDGYMQANKMASGLLLHRSGGMHRSSNSALEKHSGYTSDPRIENRVPPSLDGVVSEPQPGFSWQTAEAQSVRTATSSQKPDMAAHSNKLSSPDNYNVQKARIHANLWQEEIKKHLGEAASDEGDEDSGLREDCDQDPRTRLPQDWESFDPLEDQYHFENPAKEEAMMLEEFEKRRERNRIQIASFVKQHLYGRRRPVDGWKYILNNFGKDVKGSRGSALHREVQTTGSELEKIALKRESSRLRRKN